MALSTFSKNNRSNTIRRLSTINTASQAVPTTVSRTGIPSSSLDHSVAITKTSTNRVEFEVGDRVNLLDIDDDVIVAIA